MDQAFHFGVPQIGFERNILETVQKATRLIERAVRLSIASSTDQKKRLIYWTANLALIVIGYFPSWLFDKCKVLVSEGGGVFGEHQINLVL